MTNTISNYEQQALDFLESTGSEISIEYLKTGKHFEDDKEERDIYKVTLKRGSRKYSFEFGNSLNDSGFYFTMGRQKISLDRKFLDKPKAELARYIKTYLSFDFLDNGKSDVIHYPEAPNAYDILAALEKNEVGTFDDFCRNYGYDNDSRKAYKVYKAVLREYMNVQALYSEKEIELLQEIN